MAYQNPYDRLFKKYNISQDDGGQSSEPQQEDTTGGYGTVFKKYGLDSQGNFTEDEEKRRREQELKEEQERLQRESQAAAKAAETPMDKALNRVADFTVDKLGSAGKIVKKGLDAISTVKQWTFDKATDALSDTKFMQEAAMGIDAIEKGQVEGSTKDLIGLELLKNLENIQVKMVTKPLNTETGKKVTGTIAEQSSNIPLKLYARIKSAGDDTYDEALSALMAERNDPTNPRWQRLLYGIQDSGAQSAVGVLLTLAASRFGGKGAGDAVSTAYFGAVSADSQRKERGQVESVGNIAIDVFGDRILGQITESALIGIAKEGTKSALRQGAKGFVVEGVTETSQTLLKYANDYVNAKSDEEKIKIINDVNSYVRDGGMVDEFLIGGVSGAAIAGGATAAGNLLANKPIETEPSLQPKKEGKSSKEEPEETSKSTPTLEVGDYSKLREEVSKMESAGAVDDTKVEQFAAMQDTLSDYETAFKERPVYISDGENENPLIQIETVTYPDGKIAYRFSADIGSTSLDSNFDHKNTVTTKEEAIKAASETIKQWATDNAATAADEAEAMKIQRVFDEAQALSTGTAKFEEIKREEKPLAAFSRPKSGTIPDELKPFLNERGKVTLYHGSNKEISKDEIDYGTFMTASEDEALDYARMRAQGRGGEAKVTMIELDPSEVRLNQSTGEFQFIGKSKSLAGKKYPEKVYKAYNDAEGTNLTAKEIDSLEFEDVRDHAAGGLEGGRDEFDELVKKGSDKPSKPISPVGENGPEKVGKTVDKLPVKEFAQDRSTRGKDGKFTGSEAVNAIKEPEITKALSKPEMKKMVETLQSVTNPDIRNVLAIKVAERIIGQGGSESNFDTLGLFNEETMTIFLDEKLNKNELAYIYMHEVNHAAYALLPAETREKVIQWYRELPESERANLYAFKGEKGLETFNSYLKVAKQTSDPDSFMADETFNRFINKNPDNRSEMRKVYEDIVTAILKFIERILKTIYKGKIFGKKRREKEITQAYYSAFRNKSGVFESPRAMRKVLELQGLKPGTISFIGETRGFGPEFSKKKEATTEKKEETKTTRFAKIINRRRELRALKRKREAAFVQTEEGQEVVTEAQVAREQYVDPDKHVLEGILNNPYFKKEGSLKDAMGEGFLMAKKDRYVVVESSRVPTYKERGYETVIEIDSLASDAGFESGEAYLADTLARRKAPVSPEKAIERILKSRDIIYGKAIEELERLEKELQEAKDDKGAFFQGMKVGSSIMRKNYIEKLKVLRDRKEKVKAAKNFFALSDAEFNRIGGNRDIQTMSEAQFQGFLNHIQTQAEKSILRSQAMSLLMAQIQEKQLKRYDNLRRAMQLPPINKMTTEQIREFDKALEFTQEGDEFFTQRQLETVKNTELKGIKTVREARERLSMRLNMPISALGTIEVAPALDRLRFDAALAEKNPFYHMIVAETNSATLEAEQRFIAIEAETNRLIKAARKSRRRGILDRLIPKDTVIFKYLEAPNKTDLASEMTKEELEAAEFIRKSYEGMRDYLVEREMLKQYRENYITHVRKGFLETLRDDGIVEAFKSIIKQQQEDEATFNILSGDTGNILPLEKFFQYSLKRTGEISPTENVAAAFLAYTKAFEKKRALDGLIPKLDIYTYSIEPKRTTPNGLQMDRSLKKFLNEYLNNKKGRRFDFGGFLRQGGKADLALRSLRALTTLLDLGLSIPGGIASNVGEQTTTFVSLGFKRYALGSARYATFKGRRFLKKYRNFTGKNPWGELAEASKDIGDRFNSGLFILFRDAQVRANQQYLLGSVTEQEYKSGVISPERLAELNINMGRWRVVDGAKSIVGSTSAGGVLTQYKTWAVPILRTTIKDITTLIGNIKDQGIARALYSKEGGELFRSIMVLGTVGMIVKALLSSGEDSEKEKTFAEKLVDKSIRDLLSTIGVFDPTFIASEPRMLGFLGDLGEALKSIMLLEEYADDAADGSYKAGDLKGVKKLQRTVTPMIVKQFVQPEAKEKQDEKVEKFLKEGLTPEEAALKAADEMGLQPEDEEYATKLRALEKEALQQKTVEETGKKTERILKARLKTTKLRILNEYRAEMGDDAFEDYLYKLYEGKVISKPVFDEFDF